MAEILPTAPFGDDSDLIPDPSSIPSISFRKRVVKFIFDYENTLVGNITKFVIGAIAKSSLLYGVAFRLTFHQATFYYFSNKVLEIVGKWIFIKMPLTFFENSILNWIDESKLEGTGYSQSLKYATTINVLIGTSNPKEVPKVFLINFVSRIISLSVLCIFFQLSLSWAFLLIILYALFYLLATLFLLMSMKIYIPKDFDDEQVQKMTYLELLKSFYLAEGSK